MEEKEKNTILNDAMKKIENKFGKGVIRHTNDFLEWKDNVISTGSINLDNVLSVGGFPKGRIIEIYGNESSGKTTIAMQTVAECQKAGGRVAYIDAENAIDLNYVKKIGVDVDKLLLAQPESGEQAFTIMDSLIKTDQIDLIVVDSVAALIPQSELDGEVFEQNIGAHARLMSKGLRMVQNSISKHNVCVIFINQLREKVGVMFGNPEITTGGRALKFFSTMRLEVKKAELLKEGNEAIGIKSKVTIVKNKVGVPLRMAYIDIFFGKGFDYRNELVNFAINYNIIKKNGSWFYYGEEKLGQGRMQLDEFLKNNNSVYEEIKTQTLNMVQENAEM